MVVFFPWDIVILGCGQLGSNLKKQLEAEKYRVLGIRRNPVNYDLTWLSLDLEKPESWSQLADIPLTRQVVFVVILTPDERTKEAYRKRYLCVSKYLRQFVSVSHRQHRVIWVSSTVVFGQCQIGRLDESVAIESDHWRGHLLAKAEKQILRAEARTTVIRFSGLYDMQSLLRLKYAEMRSQIIPETISNRLHREDATSWLRELVIGYLNDKALPSLIHGVDEGSVPYRQLFESLDGQRSKLDHIFDGRVIATQYRHLMPELRYPNFLSLINLP